MASPPQYASTGGSHGLRPRTPLMVAGAIVLAVAVVAGSILLGTYIGSQRATPAPAPTVTTAPTAVPSATAAPTATPQPATSAAPVPLAGFGAGPFTGGTAISGQLTSVGSVRAAAQTGYDRFVIDLGQSPLQQYEIRTQPTSKFTLDPRGEVVTLSGSGGVMVLLYNASNHESFTGTTDIHTGLGTIKEARLVGDFEGIVTWGLGINGPGYVHAMTLTNPNRLVIDVQT